MRLRIFAALLVGGATAANAAQYPLTDADALMFGDVETITAHRRGHLAGSRAALRPGLRGDPARQSRRRHLAAGRGHHHRHSRVSGCCRRARAKASWSIYPSIASTTFPKPKKGETPQVITYPVSIGKMDWNTPLGKTRVVDKRKNPTWTPPESVRKEHAERGDPLPAVVKAGPDNPLGAVCHAARHHAGRLSHPRHQQSRSRWAWPSRTAASACIPRTSKRCFRWCR